MSWNINDWDTVEDPKWEVTEDDTDDEFDDIALSRLGIELPECAREPVRPRPQTQGAGVDMTPVMERWSQMMQGMDLEPSLRAAMQSVMTDDGTFHFGDEPRGIDPVIAGFDDVDEPEDTPAEHDPMDDVCYSCGNPHYDCSCGDEEIYCPECGEPHEDCECEY